MGIPLYQVDSFASRPFAGNPAAVCLLDEPAEASWMQSVAAEMNLAETAFVVPADGSYSLRWFTPAVEVDLCGHATLASAHILWETDHLSADRPALFDTRSGRLTCRRVGSHIEMDFPADPPSPCDPPDGLADTLGVEPIAYLRGRYDSLVEIESEDALRALRPDFRRLIDVPVRGVIVTTRGESDYDFVSRFFAPGAGIDEDPVTGSAHCCLAPYWADKIDKPDLHAFQASKRGGEVQVRLNNDRVILGGQAITVLQGELTR